MAVALPGTNPAELLELDGRTFDELELAVAERWTPELELLAINAELTHALYAAFVAANSKKGAQVPKPLRIPRPGDAAAEQDGPRRMSAGEFARAMSGGGS